MADVSDAVFKGGALNSKKKKLIVLAVGRVTQCPWCIDGHTKAAKRLGAI
ncbi:MAG: carboxymuconolactone decarboxylase family protein, partial [Acidobacteriaceae bacterium]|nr:carboxymuconolactone decarboxylase family protein [Acidobacteriaceae bacterium]